MEKVQRALAEARADAIHRAYYPAKVVLAQQAVTERRHGVGRAHWKELMFTPDEQDIRRFSWRLVRRLMKRSPGRGRSDGRQRAAARNGLGNNCLATMAGESWGLILNGRLEAAERLLNSYCDRPRRGAAFKMIEVVQVVAEA